MISMIINSAIGPGIGAFLGALLAFIFNILLDKLRIHNKELEALDKARWTISIISNKFNEIRTKWTQISEQEVLREFSREEHRQNIIQNPLNHDYLNALRFIYFPETFETPHINYNELAFLIKENSQLLNNIMRISALNDHVSTLFKERNDIYLKLSMKPMRIDDSFVIRYDPMQVLLIQCTNQIQSSITEENIKDIANVLNETMDYINDISQQGRLKILFRC